MFYLHTKERGSTRVCVCVLERDDDSMCVCGCAFAIYFCRQIYLSRGTLLYMLNIAAKGNGLMVIIIIFKPV